MIDMAVWARDSTFGFQTEKDLQSSSPITWRESHSSKAFVQRAEKHAVAILQSLHQKRQKVDREMHF